MTNEEFIKKMDAAEQVWLLRRIAWRERYGIPADSIRFNNYSDDMVKSMGEIV